MNIEIQEVAPKGSRRTELGRIVVSPPNVVGPLVHRSTGNFYMCCNRAFLTEESYHKHKNEKSEHGKPIDFSKFPKPLSKTKTRPTLQSERSSILEDTSTREFWVTKKEGIVDQVFEVNGFGSEQDPAVFGSNKLQKISVTDVDKSGEGGKGWRRCSLCNLETTKMARHLRHCHTGGDYKCQYCTCTFTSNKGRARHQLKMHRVKTLPNFLYKNNISCANRRELTSTNVIKRMKSWLKNGRRVDCLVCKKTFSSPHTLKEHLNTHYGIRPYKCEFCRMEFVHRSNLQRHKTTAHSGPLKYFCNVCSSGFSTSKTLTLHKMSVHKQSSKEVKAKLLEKRKQDPPNLLNSTVINPNPNLKMKPEPPNLKLECPSPNAEGHYECHICQKKLTTAQTWRGHIRIHQNLKPYTCKLCKMSFRLHATMTSHMRTAHTHGPHKCPHCSCRYKGKNALSRHVHHYHSQRQTSQNNSPLKTSNGKDPPKKAMTGLSNIEDDIAGYKCNLCGIIVKELKQFEEHKILHSNAKSSQCNLCLKMLRGPVQINLHKKQVHGNGNHRCPFCCCRYQLSQKLFRHLAIAHGMQRSEWNFQDKCIFPEARNRIQQSLCNFQETPPPKLDTVKTDGTSGAVREKLMVECDLCHIKVTQTSLSTHKQKSHFHDGRFKCSDCPCRFQVLHGLIVHRTLYHGHVGKRAQRIEDLMRKLSSSSENNSPKQVSKASDALSYICTFCEKSFGSQKLYQKHVEIHHSGRKFKCEFCNAMFKSLPILRAHKRVSHLHNGQYRCPKCSCKFLSAGGLKNHKAFHHGLKNSKSIRSRYVLAKNSKFALGSPAGSGSPKQHGTQENALNFECDICHLKFTHPGSIRNHKMRCHNHNGKYKCSQCPCKFLAMNGLVTHEVKHHGRVGKKKMDRIMSENISITKPDQKSFNSIAQKSSPHGIRLEKKFMECDLCHLQIRLPTKLSQHQKNCHFHDGEFQCVLCSCKFKTEGGLSRHKNLYHEKKTLEGKGMAGGSILKSSARNKENSRVKTARKVLQKASEVKTTCRLCGFTFSRKFALKKHMTVAHTNGKYKCRYCTSRFHHYLSLALHTKHHTSGKKKTVMKPGKVNKLDRDKDSTTLESTGKFNSNFLKIRARATTPSTQKSSTIEAQHSAIPKKIPEESQENTPNQATRPSSLTPQNARPRMPYHCSSCGIKFSQKVYYERHLKKAHIRGGIKCDQCSCSFAGIYSLSAHKRVYHSVASLEPSFETETGTNHLFPITPSKQEVLEYKLNEITKNCASSENVQQELTTTEDLRDESPTRTSLRKIRAVITPPKNVQTVALPFNCNYCQKSFPTRKRLDVHILSHTKPEVCSKCSMGFRCKEELSKHLKTHHGHGEFQCHFCSCKFPSEKSMKLHASAIHKDKPAFLPQGIINNFVIEHEQYDEFDDDDEPFIHVDSAYSLDGEANDDSEPIVEGIYSTNYASGNAVDREAEGDSNDMMVDNYQISNYWIPQTEDRGDGGDHQEMQFENGDLAEVTVYNGNSDEVHQNSSDVSSNLPQSNSYKSKLSSFSPKSRPMKCETCGITCLGPAKLREHIEESHSELQDVNGTGNEVAIIEDRVTGIKCNKCGNEFQTSEEFAQHEKLEHDRSGLYRCAYCVCTMGSETNLRFHFMKYHDIAIV